MLLQSITQIDLGSLHSLRCFIGLILTAGCQRSKSSV